MFNYLLNIFGGKPITQGNTIITPVDNSVKGKFKYKVRMSCGGYNEFDVVVTTDDLNKVTSWQCLKCRSWVELPKLGKKLKSPFGEGFLHYDGLMLRTCYGDGHSGSIKEVLEYEEKYNEN